MENSLKQTMENIEEETQEPMIDRKEFKPQENFTISNEYFEKTCKEIEEMNLVEVMRINREFKYHKDSLEKAKESVETIMQLQNAIDDSADKDSKLTNAIMEADVKDSNGIENLKEFLNSYDDTMKKLVILIEKSEERRHVFDEVEKTTSYLSNSMIEVIDKKLARLSLDDAEKTKRPIIYYTEIRKIFSDRTSIDFLSEKIPTKNIELRRLRTSMKKDRKGTLTTTMNSIMSLYQTTFNSHQQANVEYYLADLFGDEDMMFYFIYVLSLIYKREKAHGKYGKHKWIEIVYMNILDIITGMYDLDGGAEAYNKQLLKLKDALVRIL